MPYQLHPAASNSLSRNDDLSVRAPHKFRLLFILLDSLIPWFILFIRSASFYLSEGRQACGGTWISTSACRLLPPATRTSRENDVKDVEDDGHFGVDPNRTPPARTAQPNWTKLLLFFLLTRRKAMVHTHSRLSACLPVLFFDPTQNEENNAPPHLSELCLFPTVTSTARWMNKSLKSYAPLVHQ